MSSFAHIKNGSIVITETGRTVDNLTVMFDSQNDAVCTVMTYATHDTNGLISKRDAVTVVDKEFKCVNVKETNREILVFDASKLDIGLQCYLLKRVAEYTSIHFCRGLHTHAKIGNAEAWLRAEMSADPLDLYAI